MTTPQHLLHPKAPRTWRPTLMIVAGASAAAVSMAAATAALAPAKPRLDAEGCPSGQPTQVHTVMLVDTSDELSRQQRANLEDAVQDVLAKSGEFSRVTLMALDADNPFEPRKVLSLCSPLPPAKANPLYQTVSRVMARWRTQYEAPIRAATAKLAEAPPSTRSPILESITGVTWLPDFSPEVADRRLVVVTDTLQRGPGFSLYDRDAPRRFASSALAREARPDLRDVKVEVVVLKRPAMLAQQEEVAEPFLRQWLEGRGARQVVFSGGAATLRRH